MDAGWAAGLERSAVGCLRAPRKAKGLQLLIHLAGEAGDDSLVDFLTSDTGRKRVEALAELTGGSPRIWVILSDCLTPARLDQLVPTVQDLLESLCLLYTSDAADDLLCVDLGGRRI